MKYNFFSIIIEVCNNNNINADLKFIGMINDKINGLLDRGTNENWIENNIECIL
jgi:hypothetical protein